MKISDGYIIPVKGDYLANLGKREILEKYLKDFSTDKTYWVFQNHLPENKRNIIELFQNTSESVSVNNDPSTEKEYKFDVNYGRDMNFGLSGRVKSINEQLKSLNAAHFDPSDWDKVKSFFKRSDDDIVYANNLIYANIPSIKVSSNKEDVNTSDILFKIGINDYDNTFTISSTTSVIGQAVRLKNNNSKFEYPINESGVKDAIASAVQYLNAGFINKEKEDKRKEDIKERNTGVNEFKKKLTYIVNTIGEKFMDLVRSNFKEFESEFNKKIEMKIFKRDFDFSSIDKNNININTLELRNSYGINVENIPKSNLIDTALINAAKTINEKFFAKPSFKYEFSNVGSKIRYEDPITPYDKYTYYKIDIENYIEEYGDFFENPDTMESNFKKSTDPANLPGVTIINPENESELSDEEYIKAYENLNKLYTDATIQNRTANFIEWDVPSEKIYYVNKGEGSVESKEFDTRYYKLNPKDVNISEKFVYARIDRKNKDRRYKTKITLADIETSWILGNLSDATFDKLDLEESLDDNPTSTATLDSMHLDIINSSPESYIVKDSLSEEELVKSTIGTWLESKPWLEDEPECYYNKDFDDYRISFTYNPGVVLDDLEEYEAMMMNDLKGLNVIDYDIMYDDELDKEYAHVVIRVTRDDLVEDDYE